ncbi:amino acid adenylation domain-containing protein [Saccharopolyspora antimicrobica]|uniref:Amino acid adenylation domain-containing protein n=1 Tax=Saccharopolyspora antimicrobica TaxID=455193 RepID=A0A1I5CSJ0_9PSEU|nr:non-ribosomal peptide synthetase/type I polyketide synthase [Saccharopolyspora antimicrobica]RKT88760.1 amino acid adenylation domain-containing protein [Saccharopolyspora antimicrobica]SFN89904.1 amino acid adenylation domain-containing protein [Saccharopolyspora antimicrobica]
MVNSQNPASGNKVAIIGIGCRFPGGASDHRSFWRNLADGKDCIVPTPVDRYDVSTLGSRDKAKPGRLVGGRGGYITGFDEFDPAFFGISPREAEHMDPQQRKLLEVAWEALEDGGQRPDELAGRDVGVFVGAFTLDYKIVQFADLGFETLAAHTATGTMMTMTSNRISYCLDLRGPSVSIDTACSSSLVAVHLACQSLRRGESSLALAGGTLLHMTPQYTIAETKGGFLSPDGRSRTFDADANGYVRAEGVAVVALKLLDEAVRDGDPIHAVITASGVNQDGRTNGITVPSAQAQIELIEQVCAEAGIEPGELQYVEAHGTSTPVGDPIEANALGRALATGRKPGRRCYIGSVKTNIGHTESAAGMAGLIKTALSLAERKIPPHINLTRINPDIDLAAQPYEIPDRLTDWPEHDGPARAGVNSFGFGGTNAHVVLEEAPQRPEPERRPAQRSHRILPLTARDPAALPELAGRIAERLGEIDPADLGHTLAHRRQHHDHRLSIVYSSQEELAQRLAGCARGEAHPLARTGQRREENRLVWVFTGMGPQWWAMGRQLLASEPVFREVIERCDREIARIAGWSLLTELTADEADSQMAETWLAQPANFAVQIALAALWRHHGVRPDAIVGHSTGEVAAFYEAGVYSLADAVRIIVHRSRLQQKLVGTGTMLAVSLSEAQAQQRVRGFGDRVSVAAINAPTACTLAGDEDALAALADELTAEQVFAKFLSVRVPYHSARMDLIKDELLSSLDGLRPGPAQVPLYLTGQEGTARGPELDADYWWRNVRDSVRFRAAVDRIADDGYRLFLEIGPHPVLAHSIRECLLDKQIEGAAVPSIRRAEDEAERFTASLADLHNLGVDVDWAVLEPRGRAVSLPAYPWRRDRYWVEPASVAQIRLGQVDHPLLGRRLPTAEPSWEATLDVEREPYLRDHRIQGDVVFPAAGYLEMAAQAVRAMTGGTTVSLAGIELRKALFLPEDEARRVQLSCTADSEFAITTVNGADQRSVHATGVLRAGRPNGRSTRLDAEAIRARSWQHLDGPACYAALAELGYHYGPAFQSIEQVWIGPDEALARIRPNEALAGTGDHHFHPALLDACFQTLLTPLIGEAAPETGIRLPLSIAEVRSGPIGSQPIWAHARVVRRDGDELIGDITVHAEDGSVLGHVDGFRAADVEQASAGVATATIDNWLLAPVWEPAPDLAEHPDAPGDVLVLADSQGIGEELAAQLTARGGRCHLVRPGTGYRRGERESVVAPDSTEDLRRLLAEQPCDAVVHLWNLDRPEFGTASDAELARQHTDGTYSVIALAQALVAEKSPARLHLVTRGTQPVTADAEVEPLAAPAWGIGRVLWQQELTANRGKLIDLDLAGTDVAADAAALLREISADDEHEIALRGDRRHTCRLRRPDDLLKPLPLRLRPDCAYLVTGAFGALGRLVCRTLARRGARRLILVGRTELPAREHWREIDPDSSTGRKVALVKELEALGAQSLLVPLDITDEREFAAWLAGYRRHDLPPIRGVFHLAGSVEDTLLPEMDRQTFDAAHDPKTVGATVLHRQLRDDPLDHFVLFASIASVLTTAGQTNYAAGNAFLDALAHHRRSLGLPALSVDWGPWATGMIADLGLVEHYRNNRGMSSLSPEAGMAVLERVMDQGHPQLLVATIVDWPLFTAWYTTPPPLVAELAAEAADDGGTAGGFLEEFRATAPDQRRELLTRHFTELVAGVLRVRPDQVDENSGLGALGLDSLLAMEVRARTHAEFGVALPVVALLGSSPVTDLVGRLHEQLDAAGTDTGPAAEVEEFRDERQYPLTQNQQALWFLKQLNPDGFAYNIGGAVEVRTELDPDLMFEAFRAMLARHPSLRANFVLVDGEPVQRISEEVKPDVELFDVQDQPWEDVYQLIIHEYRKPYDLENDPLIRFRLFRRGPDRWVITKAVHHIVSDAISTFTFIEELLAVYEALRAGHRAELPPVTATYLDFLNWQNRFLASDDARRMLEYWRQALPAEPPVLNLPTDSPRPAVQTNNGASEFFVLDEELTARVHALAREHDVTVFVVLLAAYSLLLSRYSGQDDVIVGSPVSGRTQDEFASVYGYFINPLPLYVDMTGDPTVGELLARTRETVLNGLDHQEYPFVLLVDELGGAHDPSRSALFQAMFILLVHKVATEKYGYRLDYIELPEEEGQFDLTLSAYEDEADGRFHCVFKYNSDLFRAGTISRLAGHYRNLVDSLTRTPAAEPITQLQMLDAAESERLLRGFSGVIRRAADDVPVHHLIGRAAAETPDAIAVSMPSETGETRRLSYRELDRESRRMAHRLRELGVINGAVVALCMEKSPELIVALLAVLHAGGAYLPLDPGYPVDRLSDMVRDAGAVLAVVDDSHRDRLGGVGVVLTPAELLSTAGPEAADRPVDPGSPAYVIYTSGSTGRPKAVRVSHRNLSSAYHSWYAEYRLGEDVHVHLQLASPAFDVFTGDLVRALCSGGTLVLVDRDLLFNTARLHDAMRAERVDCAEFVPAVVRGLVEHCERAGQRLDFMRLLVVGSDAWKVEEYQRLRALCGPGTRVLNSYGLSEATIDSAYFEGPTDHLAPSQLVPIGRPLPNSTLYILDEHGRPVPPGVPGELWVGGAGVSLGYLDEELTAQRFVTRTFDGEPVRLYRTGDLARWDADGIAHLLGRADSQVKVHGHRIETGEIEARLASWPGLAQAVVTARAGADGNNVLCAYCVPADGVALDVRALRRHLAEYLPTFMIPAHLIEVGGLPLTTNGKVDLAALPAPEVVREETDELPVTLFEERMAEHWKSVLGLDRVTLRDDFFEVGGNSIRLIELIHHLQHEFNISIPVSQLFKVTTLQGMATTLEHIITGRIGGAQPYLTFSDHGTPLFCFPPAGGHGLVYRRFAEHLPAHRVVAFNYLTGDDKVPRYADLVEDLQPTGRCALLGYSLGGNLAFEVAGELERRGREVSDVIIMDSYRIGESFELGEEHLEAFERELAEHLRRHTGSEVVAAETREQARDYLDHSSRTPNTGTVRAAVSVISDEAKAEQYATGAPGSWHGSSATRSDLHRGSGSHAEMLDETHLPANAGLVRGILQGAGTDA